MWPGRLLEDREWLQGDVTAGRLEVAPVRGRGLRPVPRAPGATSPELGPSWPRGTQEALGNFPLENCPACALIVTLIVLL